VFSGLGGSSLHPVSIYVCGEVHCAQKSPFAIVRQDAYLAPAPKGFARPYFLIETPDGNGKAQQHVIAARRLALHGAYNFRDLGGIVTADGRTIRWGQVFRSDQLSDLTAGDFSRLNTMGISLVCDLRTRLQREGNPTRWQNGSPVFVDASVAQDNDTPPKADAMDPLNDPRRSVEARKAYFDEVTGNWR
jgi:protein-tyrosine phosphatase